jgi:hypothetical protein
MLLRVDGYRGIGRAEVEIDGICLITGPNACGKTSIAQAAAAALTGSPIPLAVLRKSEAGALVRSGSARGSVALKGPDGEATVSWPGAKVVTEGEPPRASAIAAGLESIADMRIEDRAKALRAYLDAEPGREDLAAALPNLKPDYIDKLMEAIETNGWDGAHGKTRDKGVKLKGRWEQATGERYGSKKGERWLPGDWDKELEATSEQTLQDALTQEREFLEAAIATHAIDDEKRRALEAQVEAIPKFARHATELDIAQQKVRARLYKARNELLDMPRPGVLAAQPCPHCGGDLVVEGGKIALPPANLPTQEEIDKRNAAIEAKRREVAALEEEHARAIAAWKEAERELRAATAARAELEKAPEPGGEPHDVEECRERVCRAEARLKAFLAKREADRLHAAIEANQSIIDALAPGSLRAKKLADAVRRLNVDALAPLCKAAGWRAITLGDDLLPTYGGRPYPLLSASEQYRVRITLQVALAKLDGSDLVVIDAADILDRAGRNGLIKLLSATGIPAIVCMTVADAARTPPPDLAAARLGHTYWIDAGIARPLHTSGKEAA